MQVQDSKTMRPTPETQLTPEEAQIYTDRKPNGEAMGTLLAAGIGTFLLGFFTTMAEVIGKPLKDLLTFNSGVGPLSGKTIIPVVVWLISWVVLVVMWKDKTIDLTKTLLATGILFALGVLGTFPIFFELFVH
jgi:hypothetical protein